MGRILHPMRRKHLILLAFHLLNGRGTCDGENVADLPLFWDSRETVELCVFGRAVSSLAQGTCRPRSVNLGALVPGPAD